MSAWLRAILHLDMDAFYVNVHLLDHAEDRARPLVVGGLPHQRGVVASASYEARQLGIRSAMPTATAVRLYPPLKIVPVNWARVRECSQQIMQVLRQFGPVEQMSVDEAYVDLSQLPNPVEGAAAAQTAVKQQTSLPCSVGLASSKLVAKVASDHQKPEGFTVVQPGDEADFLAPMPTRALWGIGPKTAERLTQHGIHTCAQLAAADWQTLAPLVGNQAHQLKERAAGIDGRGVQTEHGLPKSISQEWTFNSDIADAHILEEQLGKMCQQVANSLKKQGLAAHTVTVKFRLADFTTFTRQRSLEVGINEPDRLIQVARAIWRAHWQPQQKLRLLGVGVSKLAKPTVQQLGFLFT